MIARVRRVQQRLIEIDEQMQFAFAKQMIAFFDTELLRSLDRVEGEMFP